MELLISSLTSYFVFLNSSKKIQKRDTSDFVTNFFFYFIIYQPFIDLKLYSLS